jgi:hypothetical protein
MNYAIKYIFSLQVPLPEYTSVGLKTGKMLFCAAGNGIIKQNRSS